MALRRSEGSASTDPGVSVLDLVRILVRGALFAVFLAVAAGASAYYLTSRMPPTYAARVGVVASQLSARFGELGLIAPPMVDPGVYQSAILEGDVVAEALVRVDGVRPGERQLEDFIKDAVRVRVENTQMSSMVWIEVRHTSPAYAARVANAIAEQLVLWDRERASRAIDRSIAAIEASIENLAGEIAEAEAANDAARAAALTALRTQRDQELTAAIATRSSALIVGLLEPLRLAAPPEEPVGPRVVLVTLAATLLGLVLGYAVQLVRWTLDTRIGTRDEVMTRTGLPVLAEFPRLGRRASRLSPEAAGFFRTNVVLATRRQEPRVIVVTSPTHPVEKQGVAIALAESFARSGQRTLLVDADMRSPGVTGALDLVPASATPLEVFLANPDRAYPTVSVALGNKRSFDFVPSFSSERYPVDLINEGFAAQLDSWCQSHDVVVLDTTPVLAYADALAMAPHATGVVVSVSASRSSRDRLDDALGLLARSQVKVLGVVLTDLRRPPRYSRTAANAADDEVIEPYRTRVATSRRPIDRAIDAKLAGGTGRTSPEPTPRSRG